MSKKDNNNLRVEKKKYPILYTLIILVLGILIGEVSSYYFLVFYAPKHKNNIPVITVTKKDNEEKVNIDSYVVLELMNRFHFDDGTNSAKYLYSDSEVTIEDMPSEYVNSIIIREAIRKNTTIKKTYTISDLEKVRDTVFGNSYLYMIPTNGDFGVCPKYKYNDLENVYFESDSECDIVNEVKIKREVLDATKKNDELYITEVVAFIKDDKVYRSISSLGGVSDEVKNININTFSLKENVSKLDRYKYTFKYNEKTDNYEFKNVIRVK